MEQIKQYIEILKEEINKSKMDGVEKINVFGTIGMIERELFYSKKQDEYARIKVTFPRQTLQREQPAHAFSRFIKVEVGGKMLLCRDIEFVSDKGKPGELKLTISPNCFEIAVEEETAEDLIKEIEDESSKV